MEYEIIEQKRKKRKILGIPIALFVIGILFVGGVSATLLTFYGTITQTVDVKQSVTLTGGNCGNNVCTESSIVGFDGDTLSSEMYTMTNLAGTSRGVTLVTEYSAGHVGGITTSYSEVKELTLSKKNVVFGSTPWTLVNNTLKTIKYTINGNKFVAEVIEEETEYVLIYYADKTDRFNDVAKAVNVEDVDASLPYAGDQNAEDGQYDMCTIEGYDTCHGAKIWYVPISAIDEYNNIDWSMADEFYFETDLIVYNNQVTLENPITIPADSSLDFIVVNEFGNIEFDGTITTEVVPQ